MRSTFIAAVFATCSRASAAVFGASTGPATKIRARFRAGVFWLSRAAKCGVVFPAQTEDRRHAVGGIRLQIAIRGVDVSVRVDEPGDDRLAGQRHALGARRHRDARCRAGGDDAAAANHDGRVGDRRPIGAVDQTRAGERPDRRGLLRPGVDDQPGRGEGTKS